jgi:glycosyltransferase involved in cell wall biosynthesis
MRIVIDMQGAQTSFSKNRGVGKYTREMVKGVILNRKTDDKIYLVLNGALAESCRELQNFFLKLLPAGNIKIWQEYLSIPPQINGHKDVHDISEIVKEWYMSQLNPDIIWSTNLQEGLLDWNVITGVKHFCRHALYCSTLHDVTPLIYKDKYLTENNNNQWYYSKINDAKNSDIVLTVSEFSKKKIIELTDMDTQKIFVAYNGINSEMFFCSEQSMLIKNKKNYILYVGGSDEHKNLNFLIEAYSKLSEKLQNSFQLVLAGSNIKVSVQQFACKHEVSPLYIENASDKEISKLMQECALFVFPAYAEGFGLPVAEAMASGAPVICANATSLPEVIGRKEATFNPFKLDELVKLMEKTLIDDCFRENLIKEGLEQVHKFNWIDSGKKIMNLFRCKVAEKYKLHENIEIENLIKGLRKYDLTQCNMYKLSQEIADNLIDMDSKPTMYIDISNLIDHDDATGIQRVVRAITNKLAIEGIDQSYHYVPVFSFVNHFCYYKAKYENGKYIVPPGKTLTDCIVDFQDGDLLLGLDLSPGSVICKKDFYLHLKTRNIKVVFVVYDLIPIMFPSNYFPQGTTEEFHNWLNTITQCASGVVCISQDVSNKLSCWINKNDVSTPLNFVNEYFHLGADIENSIPSMGMPADASRVLNIMKSKVSILMVSTIEPRKKHMQVLKAMDILWKENIDINLVIVGKVGWNMQEFIPILKKHQENGKHLFWLQYVSDEYLNKIYEVSSVVLMASECEGFGLSIVEGRIHNKPLILRDLPVFREIAGDNAFYFHGLNPEDLAIALKKWLSLYEQKAIPLSDGIKVITWEDSAKQLLQKIKKLYDDEKYIS